MKIFVTTSTLINKSYINRHVRGTKVFTVTEFLSLLGFLSSPPTPSSLPATTPSSFPATTLSSVSGDLRSSLSDALFPPQRPPPSRRRRPPPPPTTCTPPSPTTPSSLPAATLTSLDLCRSWRFRAVILCFFSLERMSSPYMNPAMDSHAPSLSSSAPAHTSSPSPATPSSDYTDNTSRENVETTNPIQEKRRSKKTSEMGAKEHNFVQDVSDELELKAKKYLRGDGANLELLQDKKLKGQLAVKEKRYGESAKAAAKAEKWLMPCEEGYLEAEGLEKTWRIKQEDILQEVDINSSRKPFDVILPELGPYTLGYTTSGRYMMMGGRKGHLAMIDMITMDIIKEFQVRETVRDVVFLQNEQFFAVAQKKYPYIYNRHGTEIHCLKDHGPPRKLQYLDKHFLLASINKFGQLHYQDISTGTMVGNYKAVRTEVMRVNPYNAVISLGHINGNVTMWKPMSTKPLVTMLCHKSPVAAVAFHFNGHLMATADVDHTIKLWDLRKFECLRTYGGRARTLDFSQKGLLAMASGSQVHIWKDSFGDQEYGKYMSHSMLKGYQVGKVCFQPYEDLLGIGHSMGISSILVPGAGEPNFDSWVANPYETKKQRREKEVHSLLDKLQPETIMLDPSKIGTVKPTRRREKPSKKELEEEMEVAIEEAKSKPVKNKTKGRSKPSKIARKKEEEVFRVKRSVLDKQEEEQRALKKQRIGEAAEQLPKSLQRFARKKAV